MRGETWVKPGEVRPIFGGQVSLSSPWFHPLGVKGEIGGKVHEYREKQQLSLLLSPFHPYPPAQHEYARIRVCERGTVRIVETCDGSFPAKSGRRGPREQSPLAAEFVL